jgi:hypothetical protein
MNPQPSQWHIEVRKMCDWLKSTGQECIVKLDGRVVIRVRTPRKSRLNGEAR